MKIFLTGSNGYIAKNIYEYFKDRHVFFLANRESVDLTNINDLKNKITNFKPDIIIHTAIEGGRRNEVDTSDMAYRNILIFENLISFKEQVKFIFNIGSGAEFDRSKNISYANEEDIFSVLPIDYYGFSKNLISRKINILNSNIINLRIFGIFNHKELASRFIKTNIFKIYKNEEPVIHENKYMDYVYMDDFLEVLKYYLNTEKPKYKDINICYQKKYKLIDLINLIYSNLNKKQIIDQNLTNGLSYTGNGDKINSLNLPFKGIEYGIKEMIKNINL
jgi:GDP-L-fucose synthase